jgi:fatty acid desaturase
MPAMDDVPKELLQAAYKRNPIYLLKIPFGFGVIAACLWVLLRMQESSWFIPIGVACSILVANCIRGLGAIAHDAVHGSTSKSKLANYFISLLCWAPTGMSVTIYSNYHLHHHRIANTYPDVDNFVATDYTRSPAFAKVLLFGVYTFFYPVYFLCNMFRYMKRLTPLQRLRMNVEVLGFWALVGYAATLLPGQVFFFFFGLPFILGAFLASVTSMIEHYEMSPGDDAYSSRTYSTKSHLTNFLWNNVSYHNEHHKFPGIPWYNLRSFHEAALPYYDEKVRAEVYDTMWGPAFKLWGRILKLDIAALDARYQGINKQAEKQKAVTLAGIQPGAA